ncbi:MAG: efflux RND transporter periplasmic adaptor subunit [Patescibacteria group bacterium]|jgi:HlyD family secretion protein
MAQSILEESKKAKSGIFRIFKKKKVLFILFILLVLAGGGYYFYNKNSQGQTIVAQKKQWVVKKEDLKISVSTTGKVVAKDGVELSFPVSGNLEVNNVYVKEGDKAKKGDKIASVKTETLEFELRSAYSNYQSALSNLNTKLAGATASEISKAKIAIEQAQVSLDQAKISLEQTKSTTNQSIANAESNVATAENNLKLNKDVSDSTIVRNAYSSLVNTIKSLSITLQRSLHDSDNIIGVDDTIVNDDFEAVLGAKNSFSLDRAKDSYRQAKTLRVALDTSIASLDETNNIAVDALAIQAREALTALQNHLYNMQTMLEATITFANLSQTKLDGFKSTISANRSSATSAASSLDSSVQAVANAKDSLEQYQIAYNKAVNDLKVAKNQAEQNVNNSTISVKAREIALTQAKNDYADLIAPVKESDLASARAQFTSAAISVDKAKYNYGQATLISPIDGVIAMLNYKKGDIILSDSAKSMATIINNDTLYIEANIEEADVSKLKIGDKAQVTFDAVDGLNLSGEISFISLTSETSSNGIVTYLVRVLLTNTSQTQIREGMTAAIEFITSEAPGVLTVPVSAVRNISGSPSVEMREGTFAKVTTGFTDGKKVEVASGLKEGDIIVY